MLWGFKASEALLGIETRKLNQIGYGSRWFKASEALLGIETWQELQKSNQPLWFKASEALLGIETLALTRWAFTVYRFKASEALLGIETKYCQLYRVVFLEIQSLWSPFRDWNVFGVSIPLLGELTDSKPLKPF